MKVSAMSHDSSRRRFLTTAVAAAASAPFALRSLDAGAAAPVAAKPLPKLAVTDATAKALGYVEDAAKVTHAAFKAGSSCANCNFFKGDRGAALGPCTLFPKNSVVSKGWCSAWAKRA
jgi:High potential iron-sulfur protein